MASTNQVNKVEADLHTHEEVCAIRYEGINARLARMEKIIMAVFAGIVFLLIKVLIRIVNGSPADRKWLLIAV